MKKILKQLPTYAYRTYRGGLELHAFLGLDDAHDCFQPEDWISSFTEAKNKDYIKNEGITRVLVDGKETLITEAVTAADFGQGREDSGVLIKLLDAGERLGIQVHPTKEYARRIFNSSYGKTECWHILRTREGMDEPACVYLGFKEHVTREIWKDLFDRQDIQGMLDAMHRIEVKPGDTVLVTGGTPHAIGAGCFLLEIQEPSDYTMRVEKVTLAGQVMTPMQIHYGVGEDNMLDCFDYTPKSREEIEKLFMLKPRAGKNGALSLVTYDDTPCFALSRVDGGEYSACEPCFLTVVAVEDGGVLTGGGDTFAIARGDKFFIPAETEFSLKDAKVILCYPPEAK